MQESRAGAAGQVETGPGWQQEASHARSARGDAVYPAGAEGRETKSSRAYVTLFVSCYLCCRKEKIGLNRVKGQGNTVSVLEHERFPHPRVERKMSD